MRYVFLLLLGLLTSAIRSVEAFAESVPTTVDLRQSASAVAPGSSFLLGVKFSIAPGWHIYWKDPGDSGLPTKVTFELPSNFAVGELQWPVHDSFVLPGGVKGNGYSGEVLLWSRVQVPADAVGIVPLHLEVSWLNCSEDVCLRERKSLIGELAIGATVPSTASSEFALWESRLPKSE